MKVLALRGANDDGSLEIDEQVEQWEVEHRRALLRYANEHGLCRLLMYLEGAIADQWDALEELVGAHQQWLADLAMWRRCGKLPACCDVLFFTCSAVPLPAWGLQGPRELLSSGELVPACG